MTPVEQSDVAPAVSQDWRVANQAHLELHLARLRLRLERRIGWLRTRWKHDPLHNYAADVISDARADSHLAGEDADLEARFYLEDPSARVVGERLAAIEDDLSTRPTGEAAPALDTLSRLFRLSAFERDVLVLCLAPEVDPGFELLYGYVQDDATRRSATPALAIALFADDAEMRVRAQAAFAPLGTLRDFRLIHLAPVNGAGSHFSQPIQLDERLVQYLSGVAGGPDPLLARVMKPLSDLPLVRAQEELVDRLATVMAAGETSAVNLVGARGSGRRALAAGLARRVGVTLVEPDPHAIPTGGESERRHWTAGLEREAILLNLGFYIDADAIDAQDRPRVAATRAVVETLRALVVVGTRERYETDRQMLTAVAPRLDAAARRVLWQRVADVHGPALDALAQQFELGPHGIVQAARAARDLATLSGETSRSAPGPTQLWRACREQAAQPLQQLGQRITVAVDWDDLVLPDDSAMQLREIAAQVSQRGRVYDEWGFGARLSRGRGISALFAGPSGTGKTMAAEVLARHLDLDLFRIDLSGVVSKYIGETEKNLRRVFDAAEASGAILFFDEADALFGKRSEVKDSHDRYANIEINYLLQRMEDYRGLAVLATNLKSHLDTAFVRRLRFIVDMPFPDADIRRRIWQRVFPATTPTEALDFLALSRLEVAGGSIKNIALNASFAAATDGGPVRMAHVLHAARREYQKLEKLLPPDELGPHAMRGRA